MSSRCCTCKHTTSIHQTSLCVVHPDSTPLICWLLGSCTLVLSMSPLSSTRLLKNWIQKNTMLLWWVTSVGQGLPSTLLHPLVFVDLSSPPCFMSRAQTLSAHRHTPVCVWGMLYLEFRVWVWVFFSDEKEIKIIVFQFSQLCLVRPGSCCAWLQMCVCVCLEARCGDATVPEQLFVQGGHYPSPRNPADTRQFQPTSGKYLSLLCERRAAGTSWCSKSHACGNKAEPRASPALSWGFLVKAGWCHLLIWILVASVCISLRISATFIGTFQGCVSEPVRNPAQTRWWQSRFKDHKLSLWCFCRFCFSCYWIKSVTFSGNLSFLSCN